MITCPDKYKDTFPDLNEEFLKLEDDLDEEEAKISLVKFLRANLGFSGELLSGIRLGEFQEVVLKGLFNRNFSMCVFGRGCGKTFLASIFCFLYAIFNPNTKILIAGPTFRTSRFIFENIEKIVNSREAQLLAQCFGAKIRRNDLFSWEINGGSIVAIPLNGEKIRGFRCDVLVLDEFLLLPPDLIKNVLMPFLVAGQDIKEAQEIREIENDLIRRGLLKEEDRYVFPDRKKMIALSSASYTFENLYSVYCDWISKIDADDNEKTRKYFVAQLSWEALPPLFLSASLIEEAQSSGLSHAGYLREYCGQFTDGSDSYFSAKKMAECTVGIGSEPTTKLMGHSDKKYILAIDPSFSNAPNSDFFAMSVIELNEENKIGTLIHNYAVAGGDLKEHIKYLYYVLNHFSVVMIIIDNAGFQFIDGANESELFKKAGINIQFMDFESDVDGDAYEQALRDARRQYSLNDQKPGGRICFKQVFTSDFIRKANEHLQAAIDHKRIWFASPTNAHPGSFEEITSLRIPIEYTPHESLSDFIDVQDELIFQTKKQCTLIEVKSTPKGTQTFDLPQNVKRDTKASRVRKDLYTSLMLGNWAVKCYFDIMNKPKSVQRGFVPRLIG